LPLQIRPYGAADWPGIWALLEPVFRAGETIPHDPAITQQDAQVAWVEQSQAVMVAVVAEHCRRQGIGSRLCQHSLQASRRQGFRAMQFNRLVPLETDRPRRQPGLLRGHLQLPATDVLLAPLPPEELDAPLPS
jgi:GNAT superfamily N-acetyltransferase